MSFTKFKKRFKLNDLYEAEYFEDLEDKFGDGKARAYFFTEHEDFCDIVDKLNEMANNEQELYDFRMLYNALLFNEWYRNGSMEVYKSRKHSDGELCFGGNWFVVVAILTNGEQITNHYHMDNWDLFKIPEVDQAIHEFDGHTSQDVLERLNNEIHSIVVKRPSCRDITHMIQLERDVKKWQDRCSSLCHQLEESDIRNKELNKIINLLTNRLTKEKEE